EVGAMVGGRAVPWKAPTVAGPADTAVAHCERRDRQRAECPPGAGHRVTDPRARPVPVRGPPGGTAPPGHAGARPGQQGTPGTESAGDADRRPGAAGRDLRD